MLAKADSMTTDELREFRAHVRAQLEHVRAPSIISAPDNDVGIDVNCNTFSRAGCQQHISADACDI